MGVEVSLHVSQASIVAPFVSKFVTPSEEFDDLVRHIKSDVEVITVP